MAFIFNCRATISRARGYWFASRIPEVRWNRNFSRRFPKIVVFVQSLAGNFHVLSAIQPRLLTRYSIGRNTFFLRFRQLNLIIAVKNLFQFDFQRFPVLHFRFPKGWSLGRFPCPSVENEVLFVCRWIYLTLIV